MMQHEFEPARRAFILRRGRASAGCRSPSCSARPRGRSSRRFPRTRTRDCPGCARTSRRKAKRVIYLHMLGAISQVDTFDYKPTLEKMHGQELPESVRGNRRLSTMVGGADGVPDRRPAREVQAGRQERHDGQRPDAALGGIADDICIIRTMHTEHVNHDPASKFLHTGFQIAGRPSAGAWVNYALGSENQRPAEVRRDELGQPGRRADRRGDLGRGLHAVALPGRAVPLGPGAGAVHRQPEGDRPGGSARDARRDRTLAHVQHSERRTIPRSCRRSASTRWRIGCRRRCPRSPTSPTSRDHVLDLYGPDVRKPGTFARNCLLARRLAERDVQLHDGRAHGLGSPRRHRAPAARRLSRRRSAVGRAGRRT